MKTYKNPYPKEETNLDICLKRQLHTYSNPNRDPRFHTISTVFIASAKGKPVAGDDASACFVFSLDELPSKIVFDHLEILKDYKHYRKTGELPRYS